MSKIPSPKANVNDLEPSQLEPLEPNTLIIDNPALRRGFTAVPNYILSNPAVSFGARLTYSLLLSYAWKQNSCFPGQDKLSSDLGVNKRSVVRYLQELEDLGFIKAKRRGLGQTNVYHILDVDPDKIFNQARSDNSSSPEVTPVSHQEVTPVSPHNKDQEDSEENNNSSGGANAPLGVVDLLKLKGIPEKISQRLASRYNRQRVEQKADYYDFEEEINPGKIKNPPGYIRRAIEEDWGPPAGYKPKEQREAERAEKERRRLQVEQAGAAPARSWLDWIVETHQAPDELVNLTNKLEEVIREEQPPEVYSTVASAMLIVDAEGDQVKIALASKSARSALSARADEVGAVLTSLLGRPVEVAFQVIEKPFDAL